MKWQYAAPAAAVLVTVVVAVIMFASREQRVNLIIDVENKNGCPLTVTVAGNSTSFANGRLVFRDVEYGSKVTFDVRNTGVITLAPVKQMAVGGQLMEYEPSRNCIFKIRLDVTEV